jgi:DNA recombination protein RmuC
MTLLTGFIVTNAISFLLFFLGFLLGAAIIGMLLNNRTSRLLSRSLSRQSDLEDDISHRREELANMTAQRDFLKTQLSNQSQLLSEARLQMGQEFENLANRIFEAKQQQFDQQNQKTLNYSLNPLRLQIDDFKKQVADVYQKESAERNQLMGKVGELQSQTLKIGQEAVNLANALKGDNKAQGSWGEMILERILEDSGLRKGKEYQSQVSLYEQSIQGVGGKRRAPDVIIYLPDDKQLIVDAKVSLVHYEQYVNADSDGARTIALKAHIQSVRLHVKNLSKKNYESLEGINSIDFVFIFIPIEASFMLTLQSEPQLFQEAYDQQIVLVSPTTLMTTLQTVSSIWRYQKQNQNAEQIAAEAGGLYDQFVLFLESITQIGHQLDKTTEAYQLAKKRLYEGKGNLFKRAENLRSLGAKTKRNLDQSTVDYER